MELKGIISFLSNSNAMQSELIKKICATRFGEEVSSAEIHLKTRSEETRRKTWAQRFPGMDWTAHQISKYLDDDFANSNDAKLVLWLRRSLPLATMMMILHAIGEV